MITISKKTCEYLLELLEKIKSIDSQTANMDNFKKSEKELFKILKIWNNKPRLNIYNTIVNSENNDGC